MIGASKFQNRIEKFLRGAPNQMATACGIAQCAFPERWKKRAARGAMVGHIVRAAHRAPAVFVLLAPRNEYDDYTLCLRESATRGSK